MIVKRRNPYIDEAVEILNQYLYKAKGDARRAFTYLSREEQDFIDGEITKCVMDARYYLENYHVVQTEYEGLKTLYPLWDSQEMLYAKVLRIQAAKLPVKIAILKARQQGLSTVCEGLVFHKTIFTEGCNTLIVAQDPSQADFLFGMSRLAYDSLPWWLRPESRYEAKGRYLILDKRDDIERQMNPGLKSQILVEAANKMTGVARGKTIRAAHMSELASWQSGGILSQQIFPTMNAPDELAFMESTAEGRTGFWFDFWKDCIEKHVDWEPLFIEFFRVKKYSRPLRPKEVFALTPEETALREKVKRRTGYVISDETFNWRRRKIREFISLEGSEWKFYQEYPVGWREAFQGTGLCAFNKRKLQSILERQCADPLFIGEIDYNAESRQKLKLNLYPVTPEAPIPAAEGHGTRLRVWEEPADGESYYVAGDVAHGVAGGDYSCAQVMKIGHGGEPDVQVAEWRGHINPTPFGYVLAALGYWYNTAQIAVECNDVGSKTSMVLSQVLEYDNLFRWKHYDKVRHSITDFLGWYTNSKTRDLIISNGREFIDEGNVIIRSEDLIDECMDFSSDDGGRFEGQSTHDDRVMAFLICLWCAHDSDFGKEAAQQPRSKDAVGETTFFLFDNLDRLRHQTNSRVEAEDMVKANPGWRLLSPPARRDYANTEFSPVHDRQGPRAEMHYDREIPAEFIMHDNMQTIPSEDGKDDWKNY